MSTDRASDNQAHPSRTLENVTAATGATSTAETEISDETLEAVAGGGVAKPPLHQPLVGHG
ncbi:hypothetical protein [Stenomitos frigidus]|uniref:Uncharacterized protein n=1 Tax=Stenomitos frigidus ULC18 TaxID=2107698 RepID=A0A2T1ECX3_9CYAN|nr:hypothetical protein [Stenomitos frigidus]PSB30533.1 hypothetical protein C7B82_08785 [Stenomitos frigidus ULC18]